MRTSIVIITLSALASAASAAVLQKRQGPPCVMTCIEKAAKAIDCSTMDAQCLCTSEPFINTVAVCFAGECSTTEADAGVKLGQELCKAIGISVSIPNAAASVLASGTTGNGASTAAPAPATQASTTAPASSPSSASAAQSSSPVVSATGAVSSSIAASSAAAKSSAAPTGAGVALTGNVALAGLAVVGALLTLMV